MAIGYFEARKAEAAFGEYKRLAEEYWAVLAGQDAQNRATTLRQELAERFSEVNLYARLLGVGVEGYSYPAPIVGGPVVPVNLLSAAYDPHQGHSSISEQSILDVLNRATGAARLRRRRARNRLLNPVAWLVDVPATIVRWPFLILEKAGVSAKIEEHIVGQVVKAVMVAALWGFVAYFSIERWASGELLKDIQQVFKH